MELIANEILFAAYMLSTDHHTSFYWSYGCRNARYVQPMVAPRGMEKQEFIDELIKLIHHLDLYPDPQMKYYDKRIARGTMEATFDAATDRLTLRWRAAKAE